MSDCKREIGGYFGLERFTGEEYHKDAVAVNTGRNALLYVLRARGVKKLYIPAFLCDTVAELCRREGYPFEEYAVGEDFLPQFDRTLGEGEWMYVVNYYGQLSNACIEEYKQKYDRVIADYVQAFFQKPAANVDTVYSCRKFFGVADGGYAATAARLDTPLSVDSSKDRMVHVLGRFEECGSAYYTTFQQNDESFYELPLAKMSPLTQNLLKAVDYEAVCAVRNRNFEQLHRVLGEQNRLLLRVPMGAYAYPFYCKNGVAVRRALAARNIYVPMLWPTLSEKATPLERDYAENILPLPCDQRYDAEDMEYMISVLKETMGECKYG